MIINTDEINQIYVSNEFVDMRKSIDSLSVLVETHFDLNVLDHSLFIFTNRNRTMIKILYYQSNGFWLFTRKLENGKFKFHKEPGKGVLTVTKAQLNWLVEGLDFYHINTDIINKKRILV